MPSVSCSVPYDDCEMEGQWPYRCCFFFLFGAAVIIAIVDLIVVYLASLSRFYVRAWGEIQFVPLKRLSDKNTYMLFYAIVTDNSF